MRNLLRDELTQEEIVRILSGAPKQPLLPPLGSKMWRSVAAIPAIQKWMEPMRRLAEQEIASPMPELPDALYRDFAATGARLPFENAYFDRRRRFARAAMCALTEEGESRGKWLLSMQSKIEAILDETSWALPAHVNSPTGKDPLQIDLFAAETANAMAETLDLFGAVLTSKAIEEVFESVDAICQRFGKHTVFLASSFQALKDAAHLGERGDVAARALNGFKGETARKRLGVAYLGEVS